jgi:SecD/SecF fusion protein
LKEAMKTQTTRLAAIAAVIALSLIVTVNPAWYKRGTDLGGGTILVYRIDPNAGEQNNEYNRGKLAETLKARLDPQGQFGYVVRPIGSELVEIIMPQSDAAEVERVKRTVSKQGELRFAIVASPRKHATAIERANLMWPEKKIGESAQFTLFGVWNPLNTDDPADARLIEEGKKAWPNLKVVDDGRSTAVYWVPVRRVERTVINPDDSKKAEQNRKYALNKAGRIHFVLARWDSDGAGVPGDALTKTDDNGDRWVLMHNDEYKVTGDRLRFVSATAEGGSVGVNFRLDSIGGNQFLALTREFAPAGDYRFHLGVILDNRLRSAPFLNGVISDSGIIQLGGNADMAEAQEYEKILNGGRLPVALEKEPSSQMTQAPTLGQDAIFRSFLAMIGAVALIFAFVLLYYRGLGVIAITTLILNVLLTVAAMNATQATWTLPGLAALVLTVGMAVDANVLIFERMREEMERGASVAATVRLGFDRAWAAIFDGNITTIITAAILYSIGTDAVKGFAITLTIGLVANLFCSVWVAHVLLDWLVSARIIRSFSMMKFLTGTNLDFMSIRRACYMASMLLIAAGLSTMLARGQRNFDIDFTGGTMCRIHFDEQLKIEDVREMAGKAFRDSTVEQVYSFAGDATGSRFTVRIPPQAANGDPATVRRAITDAFKSKLKPPTATLGAVEPVKAAAVGGAGKAVSDPFEAMTGAGKVRVTTSQAMTVAALQKMAVLAMKATEPTMSDVEGSFVIVGDDASKTGVDVSGDNLMTSFELATKADISRFAGELKKSLESEIPFEFFSQFGPQIAGNTREAALVAIALSWVGIIAYVGFRFGSWAFGAAGVVALVHDVLVAAGVTAMVSLLGATVPGLSFLYITDMKMDLNAVAALLTLTGYSINDTIVIFDRIREIRGKSPVTRDLINRALNETLSRTIITSTLTLASVLTLFLFGGETLRTFTFILVIGFVTGCYSTIYIASPLVAAIWDWEEKRKAAKAAAAGRPVLAKA